MDIALGPFLVGDVIGTGGAGVVRRGLHVESRVPVAVKLLGKKRSKTALAWLENEVRQVARLSHSNIIHVLDYGVVDKRTARESDDRLPEGSPYLVMEHASGGSLDKVPMPVPFRTAIETMVELLAGLAHAHARGVVHRDLKPSNVLLSTAADERPGLKVSDFGLALDVRRDDGVMDGGTPLYMAPEQFVSGRSGPEVDIYAAGCILFQLLVGQTPFVEKSQTALMLAHLEGNVPRIEPADAPPGFFDVLSRFLAKAPEERFRNAADASHALFALTGGDVRRGLPVGLAALGSATFDAPTGTTAVFRQTPARDPIALANDVTRRARAKTNDPAPSLTPPEGTSALAKIARRGDAPPFPSTWRVAGEEHHRKKLHDAGLTLFGFRTTPFVGREDERDRLWSLLGEVHATQRPRVALVRGPSGTGKSRLATWLAERAVEVGAARALFVSVPDAPGAKDALAAALSRALHVSPRSSTIELDLLNVWQREIGESVSRDELRALLVPGEAESARGFRSQSERHAATLRLFSALARERPLVVHVDDIVRSPDLIAIARALFRTDRDIDVPVLLVGTAADEEVALRGEGQAQLELLATEEGAHAIALDALDPSSHATLIDGLLGLDPDVAAHLRARTSGNPLYLVNILSDWIERGALRIGPHGYQLMDDEQRATPSGTVALWEQRVARAVNGEDARHALEIAAVLGLRVEQFEWSAVLKTAGVGHAVDVRELPARLASLGLVTVDDDGFRFVHAMVRETILRHAETLGRASAHHRAAARALGELYGRDALGMAGRIGRHLILGDEGAEALALLSSGAEQLFARGEAFEAEELLVLWRDAVRALALKDDDERVLPGLLLEARVFERLGHLEAARARATRAGRAATQIGHVGFQIDALLVESALYLDEGALAPAHERADEARALARGKDPLRLAHAERTLGDVAYYRGERDRALDHYATAMALFRGTHERHQLAVCLWSRGYVLMGRGEFEEAEKLFRSHLEIARKDGDRFLEANAQNALGELCRRQGKFDDAERRYQTAIRLAGATGSSKRFVYRLNVAHTCLARGDVKRARLLAEEAMTRLEEVGDRLGVCTGAFVLAACAIARDDVTTFEHELARAFEIERGLSFVDDDLAFTAEMAAARALEKGRASHARLAYAFARDKWRALGENVRADAAARAHDAIPPR